MLLLPRSSFSTICRSLLAHEWVTSVAEVPANKHKTILLLHGLFGDKKNLKRFAKQMCQRFSKWQVLLVDLPGHGETPALNKFADNLPSVHSTAEDIAYTCAQIGSAPPTAVIGHSLGGKVALAYLESSISGHFDTYFPLRATTIVPRSTWTLDSVPGIVKREEMSGATKRHFDNVDNVLKAVARVRMPVASKSVLMAELLQQGVSEAMAQRMTMNMASAPGGGLVFVLDLRICGALFNNYSSTDFLPLVELIGSGVVPGSRLDMVRAGRNASSWPAHRVTALESLCVNGKSATLSVLPKSGHNVHIDNPSGLLELMTPFFSAE